MARPAAAPRYEPGRAAGDRRGGRARGRRASCATRSPAPRVNVTAKSSPTDLVSEADHAAERLIRERLAARAAGRRLPRRGGRRRDGERERLRWVVDPLDGTINFLFGIPQWAVSIACEDEHGTLAASIYDPMRDELWTAERDGPALLDGRPIAGRRRGTISRRRWSPPGFGYDAEVRAPAGRGRRRAAAAGARHPPVRLGGARPRLDRRRPLRRVLRARPERLGPRGRRAAVPARGARGADARADAAGGRAACSLRQMIARSMRWKRSSLGRTRHAHRRSYRVLHPDPDPGVPGAAPLAASGAGRPEGPRRSATAARARRPASSVAGSASRSRRPRRRSPRAAAPAAAAATRCRCSQRQRSALAQRASPSGVACACATLSSARVVEPLGRVRPRAVRRARRPAQVERVDGLNCEADRIVAPVAVELGGHQPVEHLGVADLVPDLAGHVDVEVPRHVRVLVRVARRQLGRTQLGVHQRRGVAAARRLVAVLADLDERVAGGLLERRQDFERRGLAAARRAARRGPRTPACSRPAGSSVMWRSCRCSSCGEQPQARLVDQRVEVREVDPEAWISVGLSSPYAISRYACVSSVFARSRRFAELVAGRAALRSLQLGQAARILLTARASS